MDIREHITLNSDAIRRGRTTQALSQRQLSRMTDIRLAALLKLEKGGSCDRVTLNMLFKLADALCVEPAALIAQQTRESVSPEPDDIQVEAALAQAGKLINRDDLAWALGWDIERTRQGLGALEDRLRGTGQRLRAGKFGWYGLGAAGGVLTEDAAACLERTGFSEFGIQRRHARVLARLARGERLTGIKTASRHRVLRAQDAIGELLRANIIGVIHDGLALNPDVAFSLCLEDVRVAEPKPLRPQARRARARYGQD
jgi:transcriptional regulator with XRE-family HTH domain